MYNIIKAKGARALSAFFSLAAQYMAPCEARYIRRYLPRRDGSGVCLLAEAEGKARAGVFAWTSGKTGFFSMLCGEWDAFGSLLTEAEEFCRLRGAETVYGPIFPDSSGLFMGQCGSGAITPGLFTGGANRGQTEALKTCGYLPYIRTAAYTLFSKGVNPFLTVSNSAKKRFKTVIRTGRRGFLCDPIADALYTVGGNNANAAVSQYMKIKGTVDRSLSFVSADSNGEYNGLLLTLKGTHGRPFRVVTIAVSQNIFHAPVSLCLVSELYSTLIKKGIGEIEISVIDDTNLPSKRLALRAGGRVKCVYTQYYKELT